MTSSIKSFKRLLKGALLLTLLLFTMTACETPTAIVSNISEKEANIIVVLLESKGIKATKSEVAITGVGAGTAIKTYQIMVDSSKTIEAIAILNQNGFPRQKGTDILQLFAKEGLITSDREETIRYQAGLAQQLTNTILMMDGVIDASVQLSFPPTATGEETEEQKITAAVYVKYQGLIDDPNLHLESKIKRLVSGGITGLNINDVTIVTDRSRFTDITVEPSVEALSPKARNYVSIWSIVMSQESASRFRFIFFTITLLLILFALAAGWLIWKSYPALKTKGGLKEIFKPSPFMRKESRGTETKESE